MRLAFALLPALLLAASCVSPQAQRAHAGQGAPAAAGYQGPARSSPRPRGGQGPGYSIDQATDANCYPVFSELRCDRVRPPAKPSGGAARK